MKRKSLPPSGGLPLTILAGLPDDALSEVKARLEHHYRREDEKKKKHPTRLFHTMSGGSDGGVYSEHVINKALDNLADFVRNKREKTTDEPAYNPNHLSIVYLSASPIEKNDVLLESFFVFCRCLCIPNQPKKWHEHSAGQLTDFFIKTISSMETWHSEVASPRFFLPLRNFYLKNNLTLHSDCFDRVKTNSRLLPVDSKKVKIFDCVNKPRCRDCKRRGRKIPKDYRELCFVPGAEHGPPRDVEKFVSNSQLLLESMYRFGQPVKPGTQSDVQYEEGKLIGSIKFFCPINGFVSESAKYVNIYTNDFVNFPVS